MPELPEVETIVRQLDPLVSGQRVVSARLVDSKLRERGFPAISSARLQGRPIARVFRSGKQVVLQLEPAAAGGARMWLVVHLRMTGRLIYATGGFRPAGVKPRAEFELEQGWLVFSDVRRFGTMRLCRSEAEFAPAGADPTDPGFVPAGLCELLAGSKQDIKSWLLRQDRLTGIGNIYACEALYAAGIQPKRQVGSLSRGEARALLRALKRILLSAIKHCGTTFSDFQDSSGSIGGFQRYLKVYGRAGEPCKRCGGLIERMVQQQRSTFYCPDCQN